MFAESKMPRLHRSYEGGIVRLDGRSISQGKAEGTVLKLKEAFSFLGGVDGSTGDLRVESKENVSGRILVFPRGKGSTVGSFTMYDLKVHGVNPAAVINRTAETIVTTGAVISSIPMVDQIDVDLLMNNDKVFVNGTEGYIELSDVKLIESASCAILVNGKVLMVRRPKTARSFPGRWSLVAGKLEKGEKPEEAAVREIMEETQIKVSEPISKLEPMLIRENDVIWKVHLFLFKLDSASPVLNKENEEFKWVSPDEIHSPESVSMTREAVRKLMENV
jgi:Uncharacterized conserved protein